MSFSITIPRTEGLDEFLNQLYTVKVSPKPDGRTRVGKIENALAREGRNSLAEMSQSLESSAVAFSGYISGHVNPDLTGTISASLSLLGPKPL